jgi:hypothetical protein
MCGLPGTRVADESERAAVGRNIGGLAQADRADPKGEAPRATGGGMVVGVQMHRPQLTQNFQAEGEPYARGAQGTPKATRGPHWGSRPNMVPAVPRELPRRNRPRTGETASKHLVDFRIRVSWKCGIQPEVTVT